MGILSFFARRKRKREITQCQEIKDQMEQIKSEIVKTVSESLSEPPSLPENLQVDYDEVVKRDELMQALFCEEHEVTEDEGTQLVYFEVDYETVLQRLEAKCDRYMYDDDCFDKFCVCFDELKDFCYSKGRIGELYFEKHFSHDKEKLEKRIANHKYWEMLPDAVETFIKENSPVLQTAIWSAFPRGTSFVKQYVKELESKGKIRKERQGRTFLISWIS